MLKAVYLDPNELIQRYREQLERSNLTATEAITYLETLEKGLESYTYLSRGGK